LGGINVHASLLPKYRGAAPIAWAIYHGETTTGVTIIKMTTGLDAGDMLAQEATELGPTETASEAEARLAQVGARLAVQVVAQIAVGTAQGRKQDPALVTKAPKLTKEHGAMDWNRTGEQVCNHVRAMQPWPTAYSYIHRQGKRTVRVIITKAEPFAVLAGTGAPGDIVVFEINDRSVLAVVVAGHETVHINELQPAGKRLMSADEFLRGHRPQQGDRFGPEHP
jgi:methionyl-tRNA formyltransferase